MAAPTTDTAPILLFDGVCNVCSAAVRFVVDHERDPAIKFASLQSETGKRLLEQHGLGHDLDTVVFVDGDRAYVRSTAAVRVLRGMRGFWRFVGVVLAVIPRPLRDLGYDVFAHYRYRWFGKKDACMVPTPELRARFLEA